MYPRAAFVLPTVMSEEAAAEQRMDGAECEMVITTALEFLKSPVDMGTLASYCAKSQSVASPFSASSSNNSSEEVMGLAAASGEVERDMAGRVCEAALARTQKLRETLRERQTHLPEMNVLLQVVAHNESVSEVDSVRLAELQRMEEALPPQRHYECTSIDA
jgi:hypothetical protein